MDTVSLLDKFCIGPLTIHESFYFLLLLYWFFLLVFDLLPFYFLPSFVSPLLTKAWLRRNRGRCSRSTQLPSTLPPKPPICTGSAVNPQKELTIQARTQRTPLHKSVLAQQLSPTEWTIHTHTHSAVQIPSVSLIVATMGSALVSASRAQGISGQLAWLILMLEATGSQSKDPWGGQGRDLREQGVCDLSKE